MARDIEIVINKNENLVEMKLSKIKRDFLKISKINTDKYNQSCFKLFLGKYKSARLNSFKKFLPLLLTIVQNRLI